MDNYDYISSFLESKNFKFTGKFGQGSEMQTIYLQKYNLL